MTNQKNNTQTIIYFFIINLRKKTNKIFYGNREKEKHTHKGQKRIIVK